MKSLTISAPKSPVVDLQIFWSKWLKQNRKMISEKIFDNMSKWLMTNSCKNSKITSFQISLIPDLCGNDRCAWSAVCRSLSTACFYIRSLMWDVAPVAHCSLRWHSNTTRNIIPGQHTNEIRIVWSIRWRQCKFFALEATNGKMNKNHRKGIAWWKHKQNISWTHRRLLFKSML